MYLHYIHMCVRAHARADIHTHMYTYKLMLMHRLACMDAHQRAGKRGVASRRRLDRNRLTTIRDERGRWQAECGDGGRCGRQGVETEGGGRKGVESIRRVQGGRTG